MQQADLFESTKEGDPRPSETTMEVVPVERDHPWIVEVQDPSGARRMPIPDRGLLVGASRAATLRVHDAEVSGLHCELQRLGSGIVVVDRGSKNGTFVGSARVKEAWGGPGTVVIVGQTTLTLLPATVEDELFLASSTPLPGIAGASRPMLRLASQVRRLAGHAAPVLVCGETGTGKELVARAIHTEGPRAGKSLVTVNVAALPRELVESEMFGHERGAFTGAVTKHRGAFECAEGGTLFLDEIGELPLDAQPKLLRALDGYEVRAVGQVGSGRRANVRVVAATHTPLEERVAQGVFRRDLFHRLEVFVLVLPPLRERRGDLGEIARAVLQRARSEIGERELAPSALGRIVEHDWPGNVRELRNVLYRAADLAQDERVISAHEIELAIVPRRAEPRVHLTPSVAKAWLKEHQGNVSLAARSAGLPRTTFRKLVRA
jgi:transcriptional regulator with GAF, ATPase, and Fis domain